MYFNSFVLKIIFAKKQLIIFLIMFTSAFLVMIFFLFFKTFTKYYIDELKLIYPSVYLVKDKPIENYRIDNAEVYAEIFELNMDNFSVSFDGEDEFTLGSLGIRSFHESHTPKAVDSSFESGDVIYLSKNIFTQLEENSNFKKVLYIQSDVDSKTYKFTVKKFNLYDNSKWILLENKAASKIFRQHFFNKATYYSDLDEKLLKENLENKFVNIIYSWDEHISLVSRALKESMLYLFSWITLAIAVLSVSSIVFFTRELADDLTHLTKHAFFYGVSLNFIYASYLFISNLSLFAIMISSYGLAFFMNDLITISLWNVPSYSDALFLIYIVWSIFILTAIAIYIGLYKLYYSKTYGLSRV